MNPERRMYGRRILYSPEYLDMGADNGGVVVNLSEGGLGFQAVGRVEPDSEVALSFSLGPGYRIDVKARVAWITAQGNAGGAAFGKLSKDSRSLIREWLAKSESEAHAPVDVSAPAVEATTEERSSAVVAHATSSDALPLDAVEPRSPDNNAFSAESDAKDVARTPAMEEIIISSPAASVGAANPASVTPPEHESVPDTAVISPPRAPGIPLAQGAAASVRAQEVEASRPAKPQLQSPSPLRPSTASIGSGRPGFPGHQRTSQGAGSFSAVPSISAWSARPSSVAGNLEPSEIRGPLFPPRDSENIFARRASHGERDHGSRKGSALFVIAIVIAAGAILTNYVRGHRAQIGAAIVNVGNTVAGQPAVASVPNSAPATPANPKNGTNSAQSPSAPPASIAQPPTSQPPASQLRKPDASSSSAPATTSAGTAPSTSTNAPTGTSNPKASAAGQLGSGAPAPASQGFGEAEYQRAENYLNGKGVTQDSAQAAEWFWRSLEAGNTDAAIPLADLYIAGNGVSRSCTQARILLDAAARKNNSQAIKKLAQLPENCQ